MAKKTKKAAPAAKAIKGVLSKSALVAHVAEASASAPKQVRAVMAALESAISTSVSKKGGGVFVLPGLLKITSVKVAAKPKRKGINPFTGQEVTFPAKPASRKIRATALKKLKDLV